MRVLFLTEGTQVPASRFRAEQLFPHLEARGVECELAPAYGDLYNRIFEHRWSAAYKLACRLKRAARTMTSVSYDAVFLQRTALPQTALPEALRSRLRDNLIFDFDDAIFLGPGGKASGAHERAFRRAVESSSHVIAGNTFLAERAAAPHKTTVIPTVLDTERFRPPEHRPARDEVVVGWMGTATNFLSLRPALPSILRAIERLPNARLRIVSNAALPELAGVPRVEQVTWSRERELALLQDFDVGLMPLGNHPVMWGKCGFKMIQYMAVGLPVVASAVGANVDIFAGSDAGYLVPPDGDWEEPIVRLVEGGEARAKMGSAGRAHVERSYSLPSVVDRYIEIFERVAGDARADRAVTATKGTALEQRRDAE